MRVSYIKMILLRFFLKKSVALFLLKFTFTSLILAMVLDHVNLSLVTQSLSKLNFYLFALGIVMSYPVIILRALRWRLICKHNGVNITGTQLFDIYTKSFTLGMITPGKLGEIIRVSFACSKGASRTVAISIFLFDRIFDVFTLIICLAIVYIQFVDNSDSKFLIFLVSVFSLSLYFFKKYLGVNYPHKNSIENSKFSIPCNAILKCIILSSISMTFSVIQCFLFLICISKNSSVQHAFSFSIVSNIANQLPISIGGIGSRDALFLFVMKDRALSFSTEDYFLLAQMYTTTFITLVFSGVLAIYLTKIFKLRVS